MRDRDMTGAGALISGVGQSEIGRNVNKSAMSFTLQACLAAMADAGLTPDDIDGISTYPGRGAGYPGLSPLGVHEVQEALRLSLRWFSGGIEIPSSLGAILSACSAVTAGFARHVLCFRAVNERAVQGKGSRADAVRKDEPLESQPRLEGNAAWHGAFQTNALNSYALVAQRYLYEYGVPRDQLAEIALNGRRNAMRNPKAVYRDPLTPEMYLSSKMISSPLCLFDCDVPIDGATAVIVSHPSAAADLRKAAIKVDAVASARCGRVSWDQVDDMSSFGNIDTAASLWNRTSLKPKDVDVGLIYDGFSIIAVSWLEALGFCERGEAGLFLRELARAPGPQPITINPHGGQLSEGRTHGFGTLNDTATQLWGEGCERQVDPRPEVALATSGGMHGASCVLMTR